MRYVLINNASRPLSQPIMAGLADTYLKRLMGLMFKKTLPMNTALLIDERTDSRLNSSIHMLFMNFDIAAIWINSHKQVVHTEVARRWQPYYASPAPARYILEAPVILIDAFKPGDMVSMEYE